MSDIAIRVDNLGKKYRIGQREPYKTLRDAILNWTSLPAKCFRTRIDSNEREENKPFWALKDVSFDIEQGEVVGIIGRNGAGKSTLLKILSRITTPTNGSIEVHGRIGSLLEIGTGFHQELTGRENIFLSGSIIGMKRREIEEKFNDIVEFAEIDKFINTPVKRYSSGMYVRLAFAVAAHLNTEILLVDEVLAVGDVAFRKKCLGHMGEIADEGRTVLFVSHDLSAISNLCSKCLLLENGKLIEKGPTTEIVNLYLKSLNDSRTFVLPDFSKRKGMGNVRFSDIIFYNSLGEKINVAISGQDFIISLGYDSNECRNLKNVSVVLGFYGNYQQFLFICGNEISGDNFDNIPSNGRINCKIPKLPLSKGNYGFNFHISVNGIMEDWVKENMSIQVIEGDFFGTGKLPPESHSGFLVNHRWTIDSDFMNQVG
jgi:lipopolysaccharide transport system ATP-binding protein